jgi:hypothetical protein
MAVVMMFATRARCQPARRIGIAVIAVITIVPARVPLVSRWAGEQNEFRIRDARQQRSALGGTCKRCGRPPEDE